MQHACNTSGKQVNRLVEILGGHRLAKRFDSLWVGIIDGFAVDTDDFGVYFKMLCESYGTYDESGSGLFKTKRGICWIPGVPGALSEQSRPNGIVMFVSSRPQGHH